MAFYLVTGGAGFIGSNIVAELVRRGEKVRVFDNFSTGKRENIAQFLDQIELFEGDLRNIDQLHQAVKGIDYILHQAALPSVPRSIENPKATHEVNATGTLNLLLVAKEEGVKRVVYASSSSIYGDNPLLPKVEEMEPKPLSPYAISKLTGEYYCRNFYALYGLETVCLRYFNIFGPHQDPTSQYSGVISLFIKAMLARKPPCIFGDGLQSRDFTYVSNVVIANLLTVEAKEAAGKIFNIACGKRYSLRELVSNLNRILGTKIKPVYSDPRPGDVRHSQADISKAKEILKYEPKVDFEEGLRKTVEWYRREKGDWG